MKKLIIILFLLIVGCSNPIKPNEQISNSSNTIRTYAAYIEKETTSKPIRQKAKVIISETKKIDKHNIDVSKDLEKALQERDKAINDKNSAIQKLLKYMITLSIVGIGVFIVLFFLHGSKAGLTGSSICGAILLLSLFIQKYLTIIALSGGVLFALLVCLLVYQIVVRQKSFKEVVRSVEKVKKDIPTASDKIKEILSSVQSEKTSKLVEENKK